MVLQYTSKLLFLTINIRKLLFHAKQYATNTVMQSFGKKCSCKTWSGLEKFLPFEEAYNNKARCDLFGKEMPSLQKKIHHI